MYMRKKAVLKICFDVRIKNKYIICHNKNWKIREK